SPNRPISRRRSVGHSAASHAAGARGAISFVANSRQSSTRSPSASVSERSMPRLYSTARYKDGFLGHERGCPAMESPRAAVLVEDVALAAPEPNRPTGVALQHDEQV